MDMSSAADTQAPSLSLISVSRGQRPMHQKTTKMISAANEFKSREMCAPVARAGCILMTLTGGMKD